MLSGVHIYIYRGRENNKAILSTRNDLGLLYSNSSPNLYGNIFIYFYSECIFEALKYEHIYLLYYSSVVQLSIYI